MTDPLPPVHEDDPYYWSEPDEDPLTGLSAYEEWYFNADADEDELEWWDAEVDYQWATR